MDSGSKGVREGDHHCGRSQGSRREAGDVLGAEEEAGEAEQDCGVMSGRPVGCLLFLPGFAGPGMDGYCQPGLGAREPTQSHSTHSHTHRVTGTQSRVTSSGPSVAASGKPRKQPGAPAAGGAQRLAVCGGRFPRALRRPRHTPTQAPWSHVLGAHPSAPRPGPAAGT